MPCSFRHERPTDLFEAFNLTGGCQFEGLYQGALIEHDGKEYCPFHAPNGLPSDFTSGKLVLEWSVPDTPELSVKRAN